MSIELDSFEYYTNTSQLIHRTINAPEYGYQEHVSEYWSVEGANISYGEATHRIITLSVSFEDFATQAALTTAVATVRGHKGDNGTLTVDSITWPLCAFIGFEPEHPPQYDASGEHDWYQQGTLSWRQIKS